MNNRYQSLKFKSKKDALKKIGPKTNATKFVILKPDSDEFLTVYEVQNGSAKLGWNASPLNAKKYGSITEAEKVAKEILFFQNDSRNEVYKLCLCELHETDSQLGVSIVAEVRNRPNQNLN